MDYDALATELREIREKVAGVTDAIVAASDGIPIIADAAEAIDAANVSALAASNLGIARQTTEVVELGTLSQTVVFSSEGYLVVYAIGRTALLAVRGDKGLNLGRLLYETRPVIERIDSILNAKPRRVARKR